MRLEREVDHSLPSSSKFENEGVVPLWHTQGQLHSICKFDKPIINE